MCVCFVCMRESGAANTRVLCGTRYASCIKFYSFIRASCMFMTCNYFPLLFLFHQKLSKDQLLGFD